MQVSGLYIISYHISYIIYHISCLIPGWLYIQPFPSRAEPPGQLMDPALLFRMRVLLKEACHAEVQSQRIYEIRKNSGYLLGIYQP